MKAIIALFGGLIAVSCAAGFVRPAALRAVFDRLSDQATWVFAVVVRLVFGTLLLMLADELRFSVAMNVLGWVAIIAAVVVLLLGPERIDRLVKWWLARPDPVLRLSMALAAAFGVFLVYVAT